MPKKDTIVFDLETKKEFAEVGGRDNLEKLGVSVLSAYSYQKDKFYAFEEKELKHFEKMMASSELTIGFNIKEFDLPVLKPYVSHKLSSMPILDLMDEVVRGVGFRVSLDNLCQSTIGAQKSAHGLDAVKWFREGKIEDIKKYCTEDVRLTRDLYEFGKNNGHVMFFSRDMMNKIAIPVNWGRSISSDIRQVLTEALKKKFSIEIDYVTRSSESPGPLRKTRLVDIYKLDNELFEGYCHLRKGLRIFKIERVLSAKLTSTPYQIQSELQSKLL